jgi:hypothetical protein
MTASTPSMSGSFTAIAEIDRYPFGPRAADDSSAPREMATMS